jgi:glycosyltransferase involved in cell wall biosynthesis
MVMHDSACGNELSLDGATVIELVQSIAPESFGLGYAALNLSAALERVGVNVYLASVDEGKVAYKACEEAGFPQKRYIHGSLIGPSRLRFSPSLVHQLSVIPDKGRTIVHCHGMWTYTSYVAGKIGRRRQCPLVLSPHGELEPYALRISPGKKTLASLFYGRRNLKQASCMWALSEQEKVSIRAYGFTGRVAVIPNGVNRSVQCGAAEVTEFMKKHDVASASRVLLFLSRIARKKNLPLLLKAFAKNVKLQPEWVLLIAGSDERGHVDEVRDLIRELKIEKSVRLIGQVSGNEKTCAFTSLLLTDGWTLPVTTSVNFGWKVPGEESVFEAALLEAMMTSEDRLKEMGRGARSVVREHFGWDGVAKQACSLYSDLLDGANAGKN